jgi:electron transfer flavoprotein alpha subunit
VIKANEPKIVLFGATVQGKDLAPRLAARLDAGLAMDCTEIRLEGDRLVAVRPIFGGKVLAEVAVESSPKLAAIRPNVVEIEENLKEGQIEKMDVELPAAQTQLIEKRVEPSGQVDLTEADTVVSGGRGMGGADFSIIEELARSLGGAVGASRSAVDEGWRPHSDQVGQTGKVVTPSLYIACGISGAIQHLAGMASSKYIVAINKDPEAPIFKKADYGIVDDLYKVVPAITAEVKKLKE